MAADVKVWAAGHEGLLQRAEARDAPRDLAEPEAGGRHHGGGDLLRCLRSPPISAWWMRCWSKAITRRSELLHEIGGIWKPTRTIHFDEQPGRRAAAYERRAQPKNSLPRKPRPKPRGAAPKQPAAAGYDESSPKNWFIIHTYSGFENKVAESLRTPRRGLRLRRQDRPDPDSHRRSGGAAQRQEGHQQAPGLSRATCWWKWK